MINEKKYKEVPADKSSKIGPQPQPVAKAPPKPVVAKDSKDTVGPKIVANTASSPVTPVL